MATAKKLSSGAWRCLVYSHTDADGKRKYKSFTASTKKEAEFLAASFASGRKEEVKSILTLDSAINAYIDAKSNILSPSTQAGYRIIQRNAIDKIKNEQLSNLASGIKIQKQINENALKYSPKSIRNQVALISAVMTFNGIKMPEIAMPPKRPANVPVPTMDDIKAIMKAVHGTDIECQILLAITCGLRQSEICALTVDDVQIPYIHIHGAKVRSESGEYVYKDTPKSQAGNRTVLMPDMLCELMQKKCAGNKKRFIFDKSQHAVLKRFKRIQEQNGIYPYSVHSLRHAFAALLCANGVPDKYIMEMGGWSSSHVLQKVYQYVFNEQVTEQKKKINEAVFEKMQHEMQQKS